MTPLEQLKPGSRVAGVLPGVPVAVVAVEWHGDAAVELTYKTATGELGQRVLYRADEPALEEAVVGARGNPLKPWRHRLVACDGDWSFGGPLPILADCTARSRGQGRPQAARRADGP